MWSSLHLHHRRIEHESVEGKRRVDTGAAFGIGKVIATAFIEAGASVLLCDLNAKALSDAARDLGNRAIGHVTDVSDESGVEGAMRAARDAFGSLDIVVTCASVGAIAPLTELTGDKWKAVQAVTLGGVSYGGSTAAGKCPSGDARCHLKYFIGGWSAAGQKVTWRTVQQKPAST